MSWVDECQKWLDEYGAMEMEMVWSNPEETWDLALALLETWVKPLYMIVL